MSFKKSKIIPNFKPYYWGVIYLLCIPLFAIFYHYGLTNDFYHNTLHYENTFISDENVDLANKISTQIKKNYYESHSKHDTIVNGFRVDISTLHISDIKGNDDSITFNLQYRCNPESQDTNNLTVIRFEVDKIKFSNGQMLLISSAKGIRDDTGYLFRNVDINNPLPSSTCYSIFRRNIGSGELVFDSNKDIEERLNNFVLASTGRSSRIKGNFWRMFYLSAVTITTVGYGDIVPLTTRARIAVSFEAILGIILIGLFLNSIGNQIKNASS